MHGGAGPDKLFAAAGNDKLDGGDDEDELHGGRGDDLLYGGNEVDLLYGKEDSDHLFSGGITMDQMWGGPGPDRFCLLGNPATGETMHSSQLISNSIQDEQSSEGDTRILGKEQDFVDPPGKFSWIEQ
jgi:Ca2+-binding RTX toxin-like protein